MIVDFKICPNCGKKFTREKYFDDRMRERNKKRIEGWWKRRKFCCYDCSTKFYAKTKAERELTEIKQHQLKFTAPIKIWKVENGKPTEMKILLYGEWITCKVDS